MNAPAAVAIPEAWAPVTREARDHAVAVTLKAIAYAATPNAKGTAPLARYYDVATDYAGVTFAALGPIDPYDVTATDLHAVRLLSVRLGAAATRRLLEPGSLRTELLKTLSSVPTDVTLASATTSDLVAMENFYEAARRAMVEPRAKTSNPWVTATKLTARKRPDLIPVRDNLVRDVLGLASFRNYRIEWQAMRTIVNDQAVVVALEAAIANVQEAGRAQGRHMIFDTSVLRLLDVALWEYASATLKKTRSSASADGS